MSRYQIVFLSSFAVFLFFLTPNLNTGDGGELATAAWFLGTAHPSSYPLYLMIGKTFTFLPLGNIAFRIAIISSLFSSLSLTLVYWLVSRLTTSSTAALFSVTTLLVSYSYFTQSVIAKFYQLNLILILLLFSLWALRTFMDARSRPSGMTDNELYYFTMFLAGLMTSNHHTGIIILCPVALAWVITKDYSIKLSTFFAGISLLLPGFLINSYLVIRGHSNHFFNAININNFVDLYQVLTRASYGSGSTAGAAANLYHASASYWYAFRNFHSILTSNFSFLSYVLFFAGCLYLVRKNIKLFIFVLLSLLLYGPLLAKLTLGFEKISETEYYIGAHQYFVPALSLFTVVLGAGFYQFEKLLKATNSKLLQRLLPAILAFFPLIFLVSRATDSNYRTNFVAYQVAKDTYSILPSDSVIMTFGDNAIYQGWYMKLVGRYREDICQISSGNQEQREWMFQGCNRKIYGASFPMFYSQKFSEMVPMILNHRLYGTDPINETGAYKQYLCSKLLSVDYLYIPQDVFIKNNSESRKNIDPFLSQKQLVADKLINSSVCLSHFTDDLFSRKLCSVYAIHLTNMARLYSDASYHKTGERVKVQSTDMRSGYSQPLYSVDVTEKNRPYLELSTHILRFNQWPILYLREKE